MGARTSSLSLYICRMRRRHTTSERLFGKSPEGRRVGTSLGRSTGASCELDRLLPAAPRLTWDTHRVKAERNWAFLDACTSFTLTPGPRLCDELFGLGAGARPTLSAVVTLIQTPSRIRSSHRSPETFARINRSSRRLLLIARPAPPVGGPGCVGCTFTLPQISTMSWSGACPPYPAWISIASKLIR